MAKQMSGMSVRAGIFLGSFSINRIVSYPKYPKKPNLYSAEGQAVLQSAVLFMNIAWMARSKGQIPICSEITNLPFPAEVQATACSSRAAVIRFTSCELPESDTLHSQTVIKSRGLNPTRAVWQSAAGPERDSSR